ncbi:hypothetical protein OG874_28975 [Nocardia sp. NBC_00565]|uniref:hypothetical protein n=1 Tax=Nocardia sp. NBC_00565 TaxID=2975993 RepID=UPI002E7FDA1F|nr:hypothetical protein [Nocardia sp. NBC_00565]WUC00858.1 hypothetical protein OG874_28975 [Nocardia sp. NBC_00565]
MAQPTPWRASVTRRDPNTPARRTESGAEQAGELRVRLSQLRGTQLRGNWGYVLAAVGSVVTLILLFQPWITAKGPDGDVAADAFGRLEVTTNSMNAWSQSKPQTPTITGIWAILASAAIVIAVCAIVLNIRQRTELLARLTTFSLVSAAFFVILALIYLNSKGAALKGMTGRTYDLGGQVGQILNWATGRGKLLVPGTSTATYTTADLTNWGMLAVVTSLGSAMAAVAQWLRVRRAANPLRLSWRLPIVVSRAPADPDTTA